MATRSIQAQYFADDKDVFDLLMAARKKLTTQKLVALARGRGIILSTETDRDELVSQLAFLPFGWQDLKILISATDTTDRQDKVRSRSIIGTFDLTSIQHAAESLKDKRGDNGEIYEVTRSESGIHVVVKYTELDTAKTRLVQRTERKLKLDIELTGTGKMVVRHQDQERAQAVIGDLKAALTAKSGGELKDVQIELSGIKDPTNRTAFFIHLIKGLEGFKLEDVKAVRASRFLPEASAMRGQESEEADALDEEDMEEDGLTSDAANFISRVRMISLDGDGVLHSSQYSQLTSEGFYVRSIVWTSLEDKHNGNLFEFEAGFDATNDDTNFKYLVRGKYVRKSDGELRKSDIPVEPEKKPELHRLIEASASSALEKVLGSTKTPESPNLGGNES